MVFFASVVLCLTALADLPGTNEVTTRRWTLPSNGTAFAETRDGTVWVGTATGLFRFSHDHWVTDPQWQVQIGESRIRRLLATRDGSLWIATGGGELVPTARGIVVEWRQGLSRLIRLSRAPGTAAWSVTPPPAGLDGVDIRALAEDQKTGIWIGGEDVLAHLNEDGSLEHYEQAAGVSKSVISALMVSRDGTLWVGTAQGCLTMDASGWTKVGARKPVLDLTHGANGAVLAAHVDEVVEWLPRVQNISPGEQKPRRTIALGTLRTITASLRLVEEHLSIGTSAGVIQFPDDSVTSNDEQGRSALEPNLPVTALGGDHEGGVWAAFKGGIVVRYHWPGIRRFDAATGLGATTAFSTLVAQDNIWITTENALLEISASGIQRWIAGRELPVFAPRSLAVDRTGAIWIAANRLARMSTAGGNGSKRSRFDVSGDTRTPRALVATRSGGVWVGWADGSIQSFDVSGHFDLKTSSSTIRGVAEGACDGTHVSGVETTDGSVWFVVVREQHIPRPTLTQVDPNGRLRCWTTKDGLPPGDILAIGLLQGSLWVGLSGDVPLARLVGETFEPRTLPGFSGQAVLSIVDDGRMNAWLTTRRGIYRASQGLLAGEAGAPPLFRFEGPEVLGGAEPIAAFSPNAVLDGHGRLWVPTTLGVRVIDPPTLHQRDLLAPTVVDATIDGVTLKEAKRLMRWRRTARITVDVDLPSFQSNDAFLVNYRWSTMGPESATANAWQPVPVSGQIVYEGAPSGTNTLKLRVRDALGRSSQTLPFNIDVGPPVWTTWPFVIVVLMLSTALALAINIVRARAKGQRYRAYKEERERIARDLHDGLAQRLMSIGFLADATIARVRPVEPEAANQLERLRGVVDEAQRAAREAVWDLRANDKPQALEQMLESVIDGLKPLSGMKINLEVGGAKAALGGAIAHEVPRIIQEALTNALRHSKASHIDVGGLVDKESLHVWVRDDGRGFEVQEVTPGASGHGFGLVGMHERARRLGATLTVRRTGDRGTEVSLVVPLSTRETL